MRRSKITEGVYARLKGLAASPWLNGETVTVIAYFEMEGHWKVNRTMYMNRSKKYLRVKEENLEVILDLESIRSAKSAQNKSLSMESSRMERREIQRGILRFVGADQSRTDGQNGSKHYKNHLKCFRKFLLEIEWLNERSDLAVGDFVQLRNGIQGIIKYIGSSKWSNAERIGLEMDTWHSDGHDGQRYFECKYGYGMWTIRDELAIHLKVPPHVTLQDIKRLFKKRSNQIENERDGIKLEVWRKKKLRHENEEKENATYGTVSVPKARLRARRDESKDDRFGVNLYCLSSF